MELEEEEEAVGGCGGAGESTGKGVEKDHRVNGSVERRRAEGEGWKGADQHGRVDDGEREF